MNHTSSPPVAWIAGVGAAAGLGGALAHRFAREGYIVALTGRTPARLKTLAADIAAAGGRAVAVPADASDDSELSLATAGVRELGPLRAAVFNAAEGARVPTLELSPAQFEQAWRTTALGAFLFAQAALRALLDNGVDPGSPTGRGSLLFTGATASLRGRPPFAAFACAKAAVRSLSQSLAREFGPQGIHVAHVVIDGGIDGERLRTNAPQRITQAGHDGLLQLEALADTYWQLHGQHRSAWTQELDLRPYKEAF